MGGSTHIGDGKPWTRFCRVGSCFGIDSADFITTATRLKDYLGRLRDMTAGDEHELRKVCGAWRALDELGVPG